MKPTGLSLPKRAGVVAGILAMVALSVLPSTARAAVGDITTVAGGRIGDGDPATDASFNSPVSVAVDAAVNLFIADRDNHRIRRVDAATGTITTVTGSGPVGLVNGGFSGDGGPATSARLDFPTGVVADAAANLFIADNNNQRIRRVDANTRVITTVAGTGTAGFSGEGGAATSASLHFPEGVALDTSGNLFIADAHNHRVRKVERVATVSGVPVSGTVTL